MFSWEIRDELEKHNYRISSEIYKKICDSPQIQKIKYEPFGDYYELYADDGYYFKFTVYKENKGNEN